MYIEEALTVILDKLEEIEKRLDNGQLKQVMGVADIADYCGVSRQQIYGSKRYLLPNFGDLKQGQKNEWSRETVMAWLAKGPDELKKEYEALDLNKIEKA